MAERVIGTAGVAQDWLARSGLLCRGVVVCGWASGSSVNKCIRNCNSYRRLAVVDYVSYRSATLGLPTRTAKGDGHCSGPTGTNGHYGRLHPPATQSSISVCFLLAMFPSCEWRPAQPHEWARDIRIGQMADDGDVPTEEPAISRWDECEPVEEFPV